MTETQTELLRALQGALFSAPPGAPLSEAAREEAQAQAVCALVSDGGEALRIASKNMQLIWEQQQITDCLTRAGVPFAVLKGLAAARYYPEPLRRTLGDIDLLVAPRDFAAACAALESEGYRTDEPTEGGRRHIHFRRGGATVELHRRYARLNSAEAEAKLDALLYAALPGAMRVTVEDCVFPVLPEPLNGLTLLAHISQHLEEGLGLRQIVDWAAYVARELDDAAWPAFRELSEPLGLTRLAQVAARASQLYLALPEENRSWCAEAEDAVCAELLEYCLACGNFGAKLGMHNTVAMVLSHGRGVGGFFRNLQQRGKDNWELLREHPELEPVAWLYQAGRYAARGLRRKNALGELRADLAASRRRSALMEALGARQLSKREAEGEKSAQSLL